MSGFRTECTSPRRGAPAIQAESPASPQESSRGKILARYARVYKFPEPGGVGYEPLARYHVLFETGVGIILYWGKREPTETPKVSITFIWTWILETPSRTNGNPSLMIDGSSVSSASRKTINPPRDALKPVL